MEFVEEVGYLGGRKWRIYRAKHGVLQLRWSEAGKQPSKSLGTKDLEIANERALEIIADLIKPTDLISRNDRDPLVRVLWPAFVAAVEHGMTKQRASLLRSRWKNYFEDRFGNLRISQVEAELRKFATWLASDDGCQIKRIIDPNNPDVEIVLRGPKLSPNTGTEMIDTLRQFVAWSARAKDNDGQKLADVDPIDERIKVSGYLAPIEREPKGRYLKLTDIGLLIDAAASTAARSGVHNLELLLLELGIAARIGSVTALTAAQVKLDLDVINLLPDGSTQSKKGKPVVPISGPMRAILEHRVTHPGLGGRLLVYRGEGVTAGTRGQVMRRLRERAKLDNAERVNWYSIRHTLSDWIDTRGISQRARSMMLGHLLFKTQELRRLFDEGSPSSEIYRRQTLAPIYEIRDLLDHEWWPELQKHCKFDLESGMKQIYETLSALKNKRNTA